MASALPLLLLIGVAGAALYMQQNSPAGTTPPLSGKASFAAELSGIVASLVKNLNWPSITVPVIVAWAAMESNWGASKLALDANNLFGIKAGPTWKAQGGAYSTYVTHEYQGTPRETMIEATFRKYGSWTESVQDLLHMLSVTSIYKPAFDALGRGDLQGFMQAIDASGYSTAANYSSRITGALDTIKGLA